MVETGPELAAGLKAQSVKEGATVTMTCKLKKPPAKGAPKLKVKWYRNGKELTEGPAVVMGEDAECNLTLTLKDVKVADAGESKVQFVSLPLSNITATSMVS